MRTFKKHGSHSMKSYTIKEHHLNNPGFLGWDVNNGSTKDFIIIVKCEEGRGNTFKDSKV